MADFCMPSMGAAMEEGKLIEWRRKPGDHVTRGEVIAEIETDKGAIEVECFLTGTIERLLVDPGTKVPVGTPLAVVRVEGEEPAAAPAPAAAPSPAPTPAPAAAAEPEAAAPPPSRAGVRASPMARRRARELGVDLERLTGTGPHGTISAADVEAAGAPREAPMSARDRMRRAIAAAMSLSKREIPHFYAGLAIDVSPALRWLRERNATLPVDQRILPAALWLRAVALAVRQVPEVNARHERGVTTPVPDIHLSVALFLRGGGLVVPALHHVDRLPLDQLMAAFRDLVERARAGRLRSSELADGTLVVTSLGERGAEMVLPVIFPPQVAIVGMGAVEERPWVHEGAVVVREVLQVTFAGDHRALDGHDGSRFLRALESILARPEALS